MVFRARPHYGQRSIGSGERSARKQAPCFPAPIIAASIAMLILAMCGRSQGPTSPELRGICPSCSASQLSRKLLADKTLISLFADGVQENDPVATEALLYALSQSDPSMQQQIRRILQSTFPPPPLQDTRTPIASWRFDDRTRPTAEPAADLTASLTRSATRPPTDPAAKPLSQEFEINGFSLLMRLSPVAFPVGENLDVIYSVQSPAEQKWVLTINSEGKLLLQLTNASTDRSYRLPSSATLPLDDWRTIGVTYDGVTGLASLYLDGELDATSSFPPSITMSPADMADAAKRGSHQPSFDGTLENIAVYAVPLNSGEILHRYLDGLQAPSPIRSRSRTLREVTISDSSGLKNLLRTGVPPGTIVKIAPGDYEGPFNAGRPGILRGTTTQPIYFSALDPDNHPVIHLRNSWFGPLKHVHFRNLDFTGRLNIDGAREANGLRTYGVTFQDVRWYLCGWGGGAECLKVTKADAVVLNHVTFFAVQAYYAGLQALDSTDRARMSAHALAAVDAALLAVKHLGRRTDLAVDFVAVNDSLIRSIRTDTSGAHAAIQIKGGSARNVVENNLLSGWAIPHVRMANRTINLAGGTCDLCFREEANREFEAYDTIVRGNRIECGDSCGAIATQIGTVWSNNTHWMAGGKGQCEGPPGEPGTRWAMRLLAEGAKDHVDEVRPSQNALFVRNAWLYKMCHSNAEFINHSRICESDVDLKSAGNDCVANETIRWKENVLFQMDWKGLARQHGIRHCHPRVVTVARDWDRVDPGSEAAGMGDVSFQCRAPLGDHGIDPQILDVGLPSMRITEPYYVHRGIGADYLFPWGSSPVPGSR